MQTAVMTARKMTVDRARRRILEHIVQEGPAAPGDVPAAWPLTRYHRRLLLRQLERDGLVLYARRPGGPPRVEATAAGRAQVSGTEPRQP